MRSKSGSPWWYAIPIACCVVMPAGVLLAQGAGSAGTRAILNGPVTFTNVCQGGRWRLRYSNDADGVPGDLLIECATPGGGFRRYVTVRGLTKHCTNVRAVSDGRGGAIINCEGFKP